MKKSILVLSAFLITALLISCNSPTENVQDAEDNVIEANKELEEANAAYLADVESYRQMTAEKIEANNKQITEFKTRMALEKKTTKADYQKLVEDVELKNRNLKTKLDNYKAGDKDGWETFKAEFEHDMEELGKAFQDLTVKNVK